MSTVKVFKCNNCGAALQIPKNSRGHVKCHSCKTEYVIEDLVKNAERFARYIRNGSYRRIKRILTIRLKEAGLRECVVEGLVKKAERFARYIRSGSYRRIKRILTVRRNHFDQ